MLALIPVKPLNLAKQRLSTILSPTERKQLSLAMLCDVMTALGEHPAIERIIVCSPDPQIASLARTFGVEFLAEGALQGHGLNAAVNAATKLLARQGVSELMVAHGDLPLLGQEELEDFITTHRAGSQVTVTPDSRLDGTNLLAWNPVSGFEVQYGQNSYLRHCYQCRALGIAPTLCVLPGASRDIDNAEDFAYLKTLPRAIGQRTAELLRRCHMTGSTSLTQPQAARQTGMLLA